MDAVVKCLLTMLFIVAVTAIVGAVDMLLEGYAIAFVGTIAIGFLILRFWWVLVKFEKKERDRK